MSSRICALVTAGLLWPTLSFGQSIFIESPSQGDTVIGPTVTLEMSVAEFQLGDEGGIMISIDGMLIGETERLKVVLVVSPGTHQIEAWLVNGRGQPIETSLPETVKFTMAERSI
jgi:hypothetical protein